MNFLTHILGILFLLLPAGMANMTPIFVKNVPFLNFPIDFGRKIFGKEILGKNKTFRGFFFGTIAGILTAYIQVITHDLTDSFALIDYSIVNPIFLGFLLGFGALFGDTVESFFKRQLGIASGKEWWFFDQTDWVFGAFLSLSLYLKFPFGVYLWGIICMGGLHPVINLIGYYLRLKKNKF